MKTIFPTKKSHNQYLVFGLIILVAFTVSCNKKNSPDNNQPNCIPSKNLPGIDKIIGSYNWSYTYTTIDHFEDVHCGWTENTHFISAPNHILNYNAGISLDGYVSIYQDGTLVRHYAISYMNSSSMQFCNSNKPYDLLYSKDIISLKSFPNENQITVFVRYNCSCLDTLTGTYKGSLTKFDWPTMQFNTYADTSLSIVNISNLNSCKMLLNDLNDTMYYSTNGIIGPNEWYRREIIEDTLYLEQHHCDPLGGFFTYIFKGIKQ